MHVNGCIVGNFETKHKSPDNGQPVVFCIVLIVVNINEKCLLSSQ